jgi:hypothetical protein
MCQIAPRKFQAPQNAQNTPREKLPGLAARKKGPKTRPGAAEAAASAAPPGGLDGLRRAKLRGKIGAKKRPKMAENPKKYI